MDLRRDSHGWPAALDADIGDGEVGGVLGSDIVDDDSWGIVPRLGEASERLFQGVVRAPGSICPVDSPQVGDDRERAGTGDAGLRG